MKPSTTGATAKNLAPVSTLVKTENKEAAKLVILPFKAEKNNEEENKEDLVQKQEVPAQQEQKPRFLTMEELTDKAERLHLLKTKYQEVKGKRKQLENFSISHDQNNAQLTLVDAKGASIATSNPVSINKLLVDWMEELNIALSNVENDMRKQLES